MNCEKCPIKDECEKYKAELSVRGYEVECPLVVPLKISVAAVDFVERAMRSIDLSKIMKFFENLGLKIKGGEKPLE